MVFTTCFHDSIVKIIRCLSLQIVIGIRHLGSEKKTGGRRKKSLARKRAKETLSEESAKKQKLEDDAEKEELQVYLNIVPEEESLDVESLATKYPIVDWETQILANDKYYYQVKIADGSVKHYKIFSVMLYDFDRQDVAKNIFGFLNKKKTKRLVSKDRYHDKQVPEGYDLLLWGDLKILIEPNEEDEIWRNQQDWNLITGSYIIFVDFGTDIQERKAINTKPSTRMEKNKVNRRPSQSKSKGTTRDVVPYLLPAKTLNTLDKSFQPLLYPPPPSCISAMLQSSPISKYFPMAVIDSKSTKEIEAGINFGITSHKSTLGFSVLQRNTEERREKKSKE
ncbi:hypothetical protein Tco_1243397 [Tanacetum coccineum]